MASLGRIVLLAATAGSVDALSFLALDHVFTANMTGNLVLLGVAAAGGTPGQLLRHGASLLAFAVGALAGGAATAASRRATPMLVGELGLLLALAGMWNALGVRPSAPGAVLGLILLAGGAMGLQSGVVQRLGPEGVSTTYQTGSVTSLMAGLLGAAGPRGAPGRHRVAVVISLVAGAVVGALLLDDAARLVPVLPVVLVGVVVLWRWAEPDSARPRNRRGQA